MTVVRIRRSDAFAYSARSYHVFIDGEEVGDIQPGYTKEFRIGPGSHVIQVAVGRRVRSDRLDVVGDREDIVRLRCGPVGMTRLLRRRPLSDLLRPRDGTELFLEPDTVEQV